MLHPWGEVPPTKTPSALTKSHNTRLTGGGGGKAQFPFCLSHPFGQHMCAVASGRPLKGNKAGQDVFSQVVLMLAPMRFHGTTVHFKTPVF